jgi:hypothetical protein
MYTKLDIKCLQVTYMYLLYVIVHAFEPLHKYMS